MPKSKRKTRQTTSIFAEDLLSVTSKCIRKFWPPLRKQTVRLPLERGGEVVAHCNALIIDQGAFKILLGVPFPQPKGKLYLEIIAEAKPRATGSLYWRLHCPKCGKETTYLYLVGQELLCQACAKLRTRTPKAKIRGATEHARMQKLINRIAEFTAADSPSQCRPEHVPARAASSE